MTPAGNTSRGVSIRHLAAAHREYLNRYLAAHPAKERLRASLHLLLGALLSHCSTENIREDGRAVCWVGLGTIADTYGFKVRSVRRMLRDLEATNVMWTLYGSTVSEKVCRSQSGRQRHDGGFTRVDGTRVTTPRRAHQFVFAVPLPIESHEAPSPDTKRPPLRGLNRPSPVAAPMPTGRGGVPRLPDDKRAEIAAEIGEDRCTVFIASVMENWRGRQPLPSGRPYDFWNARLAEWQEHGAVEQSAAAARSAAETTHQAAQALHADIAGSAGARAALAADINARLAKFPTQPTQRSVRV